LSKQRLDVVGIGNAIVDVLARVDDRFIDDHKMVRNAMTLIEADRAEAIYAAMPPAVEASGGSAANTIAGLASLGATCGFIGKVRDDQLGHVFGHDVRAQGAEFTTPAAKDGPPTARCLILITPDGHRTMNTYLGASQGLGPDDVDPDVIARGDIVYLEGYLWDRDAAKQAFEKAITLAHDAGNRVSLTLSDSFCVDRYRSEFRQLLQDGKIDILFANEAEACSLFETDYDAAVQALRGLAPIAAVTRSEKGVDVVTADRIQSVPAKKTEVVDTTGAGDLFASGFLYGIARDYPLADAAALGVDCASEVISHVGPRPAISLRSFL